MPDKEAKNILKNEAWGVLSLVDGKSPLGVPINFVYVADQNAIYFHSATEGRKIDAIGAGARAAFTVVGLSRVLPAQYTTAYRSVMCEGSVRVTLDREERMVALRVLCKKFAPNESRFEEVIDRFDHQVAVIKFEIETVSGKQNRADQVALTRNLF